MLIEFRQTALCACLSAVPEVLDVEFRSVNGVSYFVCLWSANCGPRTAVFVCGFSTVHGVHTDRHKSLFPQEATCQTCIVT